MGGRPSRHGGLSNRPTPLASCEVLVATRQEADLTQQAQVEAWMAGARPHAVFVPAAKVGGILANETYPADFLYENFVIQANIVAAAFRADVGKLMLLGSSCIYPKLAPQPITEDTLLTGPLEPTNEAYAIAKIAGVKLGQAFRRQHGFDVVSAMPTSLYGPGDNFDLISSHVLPALVRKAHEAKRAGAESFTIWGTGELRREFLHADDCADALVHLMKVYSDDPPINVGSGRDISILDLARLVAEVVEFDGEIARDPSKPDGTPHKLMSADRLRATGWAPSIGVRPGIAAVYDWYLATGAGN